MILDCQEKMSKITGQGDRTIHPSPTVKKPYRIALLQLSITKVTFLLMMKLFDVKVIFLEIC
jgi:hypothetical protein